MTRTEELRKLTKLIGKVPPWVAPLIFVFYFFYMVVENNRNSRVSLETFKKHLNSNSGNIKYEIYDRLFAVDKELPLVEGVLSSNQVLCLQKTEEIGFLKRFPSKDKNERFMKVYLGEEDIIIEYVQLRNKLFILPWIKYEDYFQSYGFVAESRCIKGVNFGKI